MQIKVPEVNSEKDTELEIIEVEQLRQFEVFAPCSFSKVTVLNTFPKTFAIPLALFGTRHVFISPVLLLILLNYRENYLNLYVS